MDSETAIRVIDAPNPFPNVVAIVDGQAISGTALARPVEILRINYEQGASLVPDDEQLAAEALDLLIANELLAQEAKERGLWPQPEEVTALAKRLKEDTLELPVGSPEREAAETLWAAQGFTIDGLDSNPLILKDLARALAIAHIKTEIAGRPPPGYPMDIDAARAAISRVVDSLRAEAAIQTYVSTATE